MYEWYNGYVLLVHKAYTKLYFETSKLQNSLLFVVLKFKLHEKSAVFGEFCIFFVQNSYLCLLNE